MRSVVTVHLVCVALVLADLVTRAWRIQWLVRGLGERLSFRDAFTINAFGDAACALTPLRLGGEPARLGGMLRSRVPAAAAFVAISLEVLAAWPVILALTGWLVWRYAPEWWRTAGSRVVTAAADAWHWVVIVAVLSVAAWLLARRAAPSLTHRVRRPVRRIAVYWRRTPWWAIAASVPLTAVNLVSRVAILPVLTLALPDPPPWGPVAVGSFALLYSQLVLPTPSGAGAVDLGFLGGAASVDRHQGRMLLAWRFYTSGVGILLGLGLAARAYGWPLVRRVLGARRRSEAGVAREEVAAPAAPGRD